MARQDLHPLGQHVYNVALIASMIAAHGEEKTEEWLKGVKANLARKSAGDDRMQVKGVYSGECDLAIGNTYYMGALLYVDGVHFTAHGTVDFRALGADFLACSPYKFLGPHCGVVVGRREVLAELRPDKLLPSPDLVPERFEYGTLPYELMAGTTAAIDFLAGMTRATGSRRDRLVAAMTALEHHEDTLRLRIEAGLRRLPAVTVHSRAAHRTPTLLATFAGREPAAISAVLARHGINAPAGSFYAYEAARQLGLSGAGGVRIGLAPYNSVDDVDRLLRVLSETVADRP